MQQKHYIKAFIVVDCAHKVKRKVFIFFALTILSIAFS